jgi:hypothetical protein
MVSLWFGFNAGCASEMWITCHRVTCPYPDIAQQAAQDEREAALLRQAAAEAGERARLASERLERNAADTDAELAKLKLTMVRSHPDNPGGSAPAFIRARSAYVQARRATQRARG